MSSQTAQQRQVRLRRTERGAASAQAVLVFPALLFVIMLIVQFALWAHAGSVAEAAAQDGAAIARRADGTTARAEAAANESLNSLGPRMLTTRRVDSSRSATEARVTVSGTVISLVPGVRLRVHETAAGPVERFVPENP